LFLTTCLRAPELHLDATFYDLLEHANRALGRLDGVATLLPDPSLFLYLYVRKEAVLSSQIEGTQSSFSDLLLFESDAVPGVPIDDVQEVSRYVSALNHGLSRLRQGFPLSARLIREIHGVLLAGGRGSDKTPGEFRTSQNWIGGTRPGNAL
jgi:Fic family protein